MPSVRSPEPLLALAERHHPRGDIWQTYSLFVALFSESSPHTAQKDPGFSFLGNFATFSFTPGPHQHLIRLQPDRRLSVAVFAYQDPPFPHQNRQPRVTKPWALTPWGLSRLEEMSEWIHTSRHRQFYKSRSSSTQGLSSAITAVQRTMQAERDVSQGVSRRVAPGTPRDSM